MVQLRVKTEVTSSFTVIMVADNPVSDIYLRNKVGAGQVGIALAVSKFTSNVA